MTIRPKVKICCISSIEEAHMAIKHGVDAIGLVGPMPSGPGVIGDRLIREIAIQVPEEIDTFLLTSETSAEKIVEHHRTVNTTTIQIVDELLDGTHDEIRNEIGRVRIVQVIHVTGEESVEKALRASETADFVLLDSGNPSLAIKELGGTGKTHDWEISRKIVEGSNKPVFLAGGLNPGNVRGAIDSVGPYGIDICSGVRTNGALDPAKLRVFMEQARRTGHLNSA